MSAALSGRWKGNTEHEARVKWKIQGVPTILRLEEVSAR